VDPHHSRHPQTYHGLLTYSANWDHYTNIPFWNQLDLMAMNSYYKLGDNAKVPVEDINKRWAPIRDHILEFSRKINKPVFMTEVGWCSQANAATIRGTIRRIVCRSIWTFRSACTSRISRRGMGRRDSPGSCCGHGRRTLRVRKTAATRRRKARRAGAPQVAGEGAMASPMNISDFRFPIADC